MNFTLKYKDGTKEIIDRRFVIRYSIVHENNVALKDFVREATGCDIGYLIELMRCNNPIFVGKEKGSVDDIERVIDTTDLREIIPQYL